MVRRPQLLLGVVVALLLAAGAAVALRGDEPTAGVASTTTSTAPAASTTTTEPAPTTASTTTTTAAPISWPPLPTDGASRAVVTPNGVVLAVSSVLPDGRFEAISPCGQAVAVTGQPLTGATVVIDPGHGGDEAGAVGPSGLTEKEVNLAVAQELQRELEARGATAVLTRTGDYRVTLASRGAIAQALHPAVFVSVHHNAAPDETRATPGAETYFQIASPESKRLAGLAYEEVFAAFSAYPIQWAADLDAGAKYRPNSTGGDYYGILKRSAGIPAVLSEAAFITNAPEEALLADPAFRHVEAAALARAVVRFVTTTDPGSGFVEPYPRTEPAGPGGGATGCQDPPLQ